MARPHSNGMRVMSILGNVVGGLMGQGESGGLVELASRLLQRVGGIRGLQNLLASSGLGQQVASWIGSGDNLPVSGGQLGQALRNGGVGDLVDDAAAQMGLDTGRLQAQLAQILPGIVDHLTPDGDVPAEDGDSLDLSMLSGLASKLFS